MAYCFKGCLYLGISQTNDVQHSGIDKGRGGLTLAILQKLNLLPVFLTAKFHGNISKNFLDVAYKIKAPSLRLATVAPFWSI
jgi:hypothetical protein